MFQTFKSKHNKVYAHAEEEMEKLAIFKVSLQRAQEKNRANHSRGDAPNFGITKFSDMSQEEFKSTMLTYKPKTSFDHPDRVNAEMVASASRKLRGTESFADSRSTATDSLDWRDKGAVTKTKDQGQCGSCWAFSTVEGIESAFFLSGNELTNLSPNQLVQCDTEDGGCRGGDLVTAFDWVKGAGGVATEEAYPYEGMRGSCQEFTPVPGTGVKSWKYATPACMSRDCDSQDEDTLAATVTSDGPPSICVNAETWNDYTSGVMTADTCGKSGYNDLDHCVQLVGYNGISGSDGYWIVRNSWTEDWGEDGGMIFLKYGDNTCGVATEAILPTLE
jgi:C1A family cysteine protease